MPEADVLFKEWSGYLKPEDISQLESAYHFSKAAHEGQYRKSGEPYISHPLAVADILAQWHMDPQALAAALLHDVTEDTAVTKNDVRLRFFAPAKEFDHAFLAPLTHIDYGHAMAFIALDDSSGRMLGVVRLHANANNDTAKYAILVRSDLKGRGLGWLLMQMPAWKVCKPLKDRSCGRTPRCLRCARNWGSTSSLIQGCRHLHREAAY